uniref:Uncharacterized protein n=1 Tax=viral metagenome TaxID=1070528 RepID=A0A6C0LM59_9ZZZZ
MKKTTTLTYNIETCDGVSMRELEYKDYAKNEKGEENLLHYKVKNCVKVDEVEDGGNGGNGDGMKVIGESFNKIYKMDNIIDETVGVSSNCDDWKIHEYKNHQLDKEYKVGYDTIKFDIKSELLELEARGVSEVAHSYIEDKDVEDGKVV